MIQPLQQTFIALALVAVGVKELAAALLRVVAAAGAVHCHLRLSF
jgi:hypothetical protein